MAWFKCATRRPISSNTGGMLTANLGLILHHAVMDGSLYNFLNSASAQVSAHFWVSKTGLIEQYVDTATVAWHAKQLNTRYVGVETEGCATYPYAEPMTAAMVDALARLYAEGSQVHGWVNGLAEADGQKGFGYHRMAVNTACPCEIRLNMRQDILNKAFNLSGPPTEEVITIPGENMVAADPQSGGVWVAKDDGSVLAYDGAPYLGGSNGAQYNNQGKPCVGIAATETGYVTVHKWGEDDYRRYRFNR